MNASQSGQLAGLPMWSGRRQREAGFTLLELLIAIAIFAVIAVAGWRLVDTAGSMRERADRVNQRDLQLQRSYRLLQQDLMAIPPASAEAASPNPANPAGMMTPARDRTPALTLIASELTLLHSAPSWTAPAAGVVSVRYQIQGGQLIRQLYPGTDTAGAVPQADILLSNVSSGQFTALDPAPLPLWPDSSGLSGVPSGQPVPSPLPRGIQLDLVYQERPVRWVFALAQALPPEAGT